MLGPSRGQVQILGELVEERSVAELLLTSGRANRTKFRDQVVNPLIRAGLVEMTIPDKPRSGKQRYRLTSAGLDSLKKMEEKT